MKRLYHRKRNLCVMMSYDKLKSIFGGTQRLWIKIVLDYDDKVTIFHRNRYLVNV